MQGSCGLVYDNFFQKHITGSGHPENYMRASHVYQGLRKANLLEEKLVFRPKPINEELLTLAHEENYLKQAKQDIVNGESSLSTGDTAICPDSWEVACLAAGAAMKAVDLLFSDKINRCFCPTRPPGHHAQKSLGNGFCLLNNVAICAKYAQKMGKKVVIVDVDVHHGQGSQYLFYDDPDVICFSIHRWEHGAFWPNLREGNFDYIGGDLEVPSCGKNINIPLNKAGLGDSDYLSTFHQVLLPILHEFNPDLILVSAGFDASIGCPEGQMQVCFIKIKFVDF